MGSAVAGMFLVGKFGVWKVEEIDAPRHDVGSKTCTSQGDFSIGLQK
jgi:hypothetical protein